MKYPEDFINKIICGDCLEVMKRMPDNSVDTIITDPPYGLSFMGKKWDYDVPSIGIWEECLRVLKPGGTALIFAGSRTQHRMAVNVEDAGFILKDCIMWLYGSGFPKASDISKQLDMRGCRKQLKEKLGRKPTQKEFREAWEGKKCSVCGGIGKAINPNVKDPELADYWLNKPCKKCNGSGMEQKGFREIIGRYELPDVADGKRKKGWECTNTTNIGAFGVSGQQDITTPATPEATLWDGWKSHGLKPAYEPILVAMKPNEGSYANNALKWGVAGLNIDGGRITIDLKNENRARNKNTIQKTSGIAFTGNKKNSQNTPLYNLEKGRYPANVILDEESARMLDEQSGIQSSRPGKSLGKSKSSYFGAGTNEIDNNAYQYFKNDKGGASRFFYCAKASKSERNRGCKGLEERQQDPKRTNFHPTVKPLALMKYLCTLTKTPMGGILLDPFCGSGTTLMACKELRRDYIGIDNIPEYCEIARRRVNAVPRSLF